MIFQITLLIKTFATKITYYGLVKNLHYNIHIEKVSFLHEQFWYALIGLIFKKNQHYK